MDLNTLKPALGSVKKNKRIGRGPGSGHGKTATKGHKGQKARSGGGVRPGFEGGQLPLYRRLPKRGFVSVNKISYCLINVEQLNGFDSGSRIDAQLLFEAGLVKSDNIKILGNGELNKAFTVSVSKISKSAKDKILAAGGTVEENI